MRIKKIAVVAFGVIAFGFLAGLGFDIAMRILTRSAGIALVPDVSGLPLADAMDILQSKGLYAVKEEEGIADASIPAGSVVRQMPPAGSVVKKGRFVKLIISEGGNLVWVPDIAGKTVREAEIILKRASLIMGEKTEIFSDEVREDFIISQNPAAGAIVEPFSFVDIEVSRGPASFMGFVVMPYLVGKSTEQASQILKDAGFEISEIDFVVNAGVKPGTVMKQLPPPGEILSQDMKIKLTVSILPEEENVRRTQFIYWEMPQDVAPRRLQVSVKDATGVKTVFDEITSPGKKISFEVETIGTAQVFYYIDGVLVERRSLD